MAAWSKPKTIAIKAFLVVISCALYLFSSDYSFHHDATNIIKSNSTSDRHSNDALVNDTFNINRKPTSDRHNDDAIVRINGKEKCRFQTGKNESMPVLLISLGRSGSSVTWMTLSKLIGAETRAYEFTGSNPRENEQFFESIPASVGPLWASLQMCIVQNRKKNRVPSISGFQWKPYSKTFKSKNAVEALKDIGSRRNPRIRAIFNVRNPLDRMISNMKHQGREEAKKIPAHCAVDDNKCLEDHLKMATDLVMDTGEELLKSVRDNMKLFALVEDTLVASGVTYVKIEYEKLYNSDDANEWMKVFEFLGRGPAKGLTIDDVRKQFPYGATSKPHNETVKNWAEVVNTLKGTEFEWMKGDY